MFRDESAGLEYIRRARDLADGGMYIELGAYKYHVFLNFRLVTDSLTQPYGRLADSLGGRGVPNIHDALQALFYQPVRDAFRVLVNGDMFRRLFNARLSVPTQASEAQTLFTDQAFNNALMEEIGQAVIDLFNAAQAFMPPPEPITGAATYPGMVIDATAQLPPTDEVSRPTAKIEPEVTVDGLSAEDIYAASRGVRAQLELSFETARLGTRSPLPRGGGESNPCSGKSRPLGGCSFPDTGEGRGWGGI